MTRFVDFFMAICYNIPIANCEKMRNFEKINRHKHKRVAK